MSRPPCGSQQGCVCLKHGVAHVEGQQCHKAGLTLGLVTASLVPRSFPRSGQDSRFEISENGTLRINNVEVYDGTTYKCVSSTPAGSIEGYARVHVLGRLAAPHVPPWWLQGWHLQL